MKSFSDRMARLEALERAQRPEAPDFLCVRSEDFALLDQPAVLARYGLPSDVDLSGTKLYIDICTCSWDDPPGRCPVCEE